MTPPARSALGGGAEFDRIRRIVAALGERAGAVGDDCVILPEGTGSLVLSTDLSIEGVHFRTDWLSWREIGWRAAGGALSDLAAAGASTVGVLVSLGAPAAAPPEASVDLMRGVGDVTVSVGGVVLGGDLSRAQTWVINVTVVGRAIRPMRRAGARPGDGIWVSGTLGGARAALTSWLAGTPPAEGARRAFANPVPRILLGQRLAESGATAMMDLSDGLGGDAGHLAAASACRMAIDLARLPLHPDAAARGAVFAAQGGEDYELLATLPPGFSEETRVRIATETGVPLTRIGTVEEGRGVAFRHEGKEVTLSGYDHFA
ncbi:MAG TPA: thiamine-phosphate kinase [Gemmatimonadales bacterium]|nr:thiamine-phosphate kinase [Gemmatimonadales bacterium]